MKKNIMMPLLAAVIIYACNSEPSTEETKDSTSATSSEVDKKTDAINATATTADPATIKFALDAAIAGMMEIQLGNMAKEKGSNPRVKAFADKMIADHTNAANELKRICSENRITIPSDLPADKKDHLESMKSMSGTQFDKHYMDMMVYDHKKALDDFKSASMALKHEAMKNYAVHIIPVLENHLDSATAIHKKLK